MWKVLGGILGGMVLTFLHSLSRQSGQEVAKKLAGTAYDPKSRDRRHNRDYGYAPPKEVRREFMPELGEVNGKRVRQSKEESKGCTKSFDQREETDRDQDWLC